MTKSRLARREFCGRMFAAAGAAMMYPAAVKAGAARATGPVAL